MGTLLGVFLEVLIAAGTIFVPGDVGTIQGAVDAAGDGDTVVVQGGSAAEPVLYPERVSFAGSGASGVTVRAEPRRSVEMHGFKTRGAGAGLTLEGFRVTIPQSVIDSDWTHVYANFIGSDGVTVRDFYIENAPWAAVYVNHVAPWPQGGVIEGNHIYGCGGGIYTYGDGWEVRGNDIERLIAWTKRDADAMRGWGNDLRITGNWIHGTLQAEIGSSHVDGFQTFDNGGRYLHGLVFEGNIVEDVHQGMIFADGDGPGDVSDISISNNRFKNCWNAGVYVRDGVRGVRIEHNLFQNMGLTGVFARWGAEVEVYANIFLDAASNYKGDAESALTGGYNILNRTQYPYHSEPTDLLDVDPMLDEDGYPLAGSPAIGAAGDGSDIGMLRVVVPDPDPDPDPEPHAHDDLYSPLGHTHEHEHGMAGECRALWEETAAGFEGLAGAIRARLGG